MRHSLVCAAAAALLIASGIGCEWKGGKPKLPLGEGAEVWRAEPTSVRVYPSSRLIREGGQTLLEARIELRDDMDDPIKGVGHFHFDLLTPGAAGGSSGQRLYGWDTTVHTLAQQRQFWDPITRAYLFRLRLDEPIGQKRDTVLRVMLTSPEGKRLEGSGAIAALGE